MLYQSVGEWKWSILACKSILLLTFRIPSAWCYYKEDQMLVGFTTVLKFPQSTYFLYACSRSRPPPNTRLEISLLSFIEYPLCLRNLVKSQFSSVTQSCLTLCNPMDCSMLGLPVHHQLLEFTQTQSIELVMPSNYLILCHPLLLLPSIFPSIRVFSNQGFFTSGDQSIGVSASTSVLPMNIQDWFL